MNSPTKAGWLARLKQGLSRTRVNIAGLFSGGVIDEALFEEIGRAHV